MGYIYRRVGEVLDLGVFSSSLGLILDGSCYGAPFIKDPCRWISKFVLVTISAARVLMG